MLERDAEAPTFDDVADKSAEVKWLWRQLHRLSVPEGVLVRAFEDSVTGDVTKQVVNPRKLHVPFIQKLHQDIGHMGLTRTKAAIQQRDLAGKEH